MRFVAVILFLVGTFSFGQRSDFNIEFNQADSIALKYKDASLNNLPVLVHNLTTGLNTEAEKFRSIYTWVCSNIENDYGAYQKTVKKRKKLLANPKALTEWNNSFTPKVFEKLLKQRKTACTGYAFLIRELATLADINCQIINGYGRTPTLILDKNSIPNHSWNSVELNGKWYLCDPTWSAGRIILEEDGPRFKPDYFDGYFLADPVIFAKNHLPLKREWCLLEEPPTFQQFLEGPVVYKNAFASNIIPIAPSKMNLKVTKNEKLSFLFSVPETYNCENLTIKLGNGPNGKLYEPSLTREQNLCRLEYSFEKSGLFDMHILADESIIATYVVKVKRK